jgi:hypothetical protein
MWHGIVQVKPGARLGDIGHAIQKFAEGQGYSVVREFCGHGIGKVFHEEPQVLHYGRPGTLEELKPGMTFTIEPMINAGRRDIKEMGDGWTIVTKDHSLSAQWEHTVLVTETGYEVLTLSAGAPIPPAFVTRLTAMPAMPHSRPAGTARRYRAQKAAAGALQARAASTRGIRTVLQQAAAALADDTLRAAVGSAGLPARLRWWPWAALGAASCFPIPTWMCCCCCPTARPTTTPTLQASASRLHRQLLGRRPGDRLQRAHAGRLPGRGRQRRDGADLAAGVAPVTGNRAAVRRVSAALCQRR